MSENQSDCFFSTLEYATVPVRATKLAEVETGLNRAMICINVSIFFTYFQKIGRSTWTQRSKFGRLIPHFGRTLTAGLAVIDHFPMVGAWWVIRARITVNEWAKWGFSTISPEFFNLKLYTSRGVTVRMFSRDRLITGVIGRKLDKNWPNLVVNLLFAYGWNLHTQTISMQ